MRQSYRYHSYTLILFFSLGTLSLCAQKMNTDSLLVSIITDMKTSNNYQKNIEKCLLGKKIAPEYLDFQLLLGRNYEFIKQTDSARYYYKMVLDKNPKYEEAFLYLINLNIHEKKYNEAIDLSTKAIEYHPNQIAFYHKQADLYDLLKDEEKHKSSLLETQKRFPEDTKTKEALIQLDRKHLHTRVGINYNFTIIDRKETGPWHLAHLEAVKEQKWGSIIGRISYANRYNAANFISKGFQYEIESYVLMGKKNYSYWDISYSNDFVFPKFRVGGSFFLNFNKGWESDFGFRYIETFNIDVLTLVTGVSKYAGTYWFSLKGYLNNNKKKYNPVFLLNCRYYFDSKYDYINSSIGFGTSPDERTTIAQLQNRFNLNSYRMGLGYYHIFDKKIITGFQINYNYQEYFPNLYQSEYEFALLLHYKL